MIFFLFGADNYRITARAQEIIKTYKKKYKNKIIIESFDIEKTDFCKIKELFFSTNIFREKRILILKNLFLDRNCKNFFLREKEQFNSRDIIIIIEKNETPKKDPLFFYLLKNSKWQEFKLLEGEDLKEWVKKEFLKFGTKADQEVIEKLIMFTGNDLWSLSNEIQKLIAFKKGKKITLQDLELLTSKATEARIFRTIEFLADGKKKIAFEHLQRHLIGGENPLYLLAMIAFQFKTLLQIKDLAERKFSYYNILKKTNLSPLIFKKNYYLSQKFTLDKLKEIYEKIFKFEIFAKTGKVNPETALSLLVCEI